MHPIKASASGVTEHLKVKEWWCRWSETQMDLTLEATIRDLFPTGHTTISHSVSNSDGTSTNHSDSMSYNKESRFKVIFINSVFMCKAWSWKICQHSHKLVQCDALRRSHARETGCDLRNSSTLCWPKWRMQQTDMLQCPS